MIAAMVEAGALITDVVYKRFFFLPQHIKEILKKQINYVRQDSTKQQDYVWPFRGLSGNPP